MNSQRWKRIEEIYHAVLSIPNENRSAKLIAACSGDPEMVQEVKSLLAVREESSGFLSPQMRAELVTSGFAQLPLPGEAFASYRIEAEAGAGAMGRVYRALDTRLEREVAIKVLPPCFIDDAERAARFRLEAKAASALNHPNIVTIYEIGQAGQMPFIAAEWIAGVTLRERLAGGRMPFETIVDIAQQCTAGLAAAHHAGILHRDFKPENIMIRSDGLVKVLDFGLARMNQPASGWPETSEIGTVLGTPRYMSPEQARGEDLDSRSDVFSLGAVLYEMTYGRPAFPGTTTAEVYHALLSAERVNVPPAVGIQGIIARALQKDRANRYVTIDELAQDLRTLVSGRTPVWGSYFTKQNLRRRTAAVGATVLLVFAAGVYASRPRQPALTDHDTILLSDFVNQTGDTVFDLTLKQGLAVQLEQSSHLEVFPEDRVRTRLRFMLRSPDQPVTPQIAREICQREGLKAYVTGAIAPLGSHYAITLSAIDSRSGNVLAQTQAEAFAREKVLRALSEAASKLRGKLGESVRSLQKFDAMLDVTTSSLEALRAYSLAARERLRGNYGEAIALYRRAAELDPDFAAAYHALAVAYNNTRQRRLAAEAGTRAYQLRQHASEPERLKILSEYYSTVTGDSLRRIEISKLQLELFPRDTSPQSNLAVAYNSIGRFDEALQRARLAVEKAPGSVSRWAVLGNTLIRAGRFAEAADAYRQASEKQLDSTSFHQGLFRIGFVNADQALMARQIEWAKKKGLEENVWDWQGAAAAARGERRQAELFARYIAESAAGGDAGEAGAGMLAQAALRSAALGECGMVKGTVSRALDIERDVLSLTRGALALAWCGDGRAAGLLHREIAGQFPENTAVNEIWLPAIKGAILLKRGEARTALDALQGARYEGAGEFWPQYLRGSAFLLLEQADQAAAEFRKILDHRGQDPITPLYPLARLGAAQALVLQQEVSRAQEHLAAFFADWKDADRDLPAFATAKRAMAAVKLEGSPTHGTAAQ
jgi:eukaryotic-like serine/threonine-protein kinase